MPGFGLAVKGCGEQTIQSSSTQAAPGYLSLVIFISIINSKPTDANTYRLYRNIV